METNLSLNNLNRIIKSKPFKFLDGIVIGRSDLAGSLNLTRQEVNSKLIFNKVRNAFKKIKSTSRKKLIFKMGGSITPMSSNFINKLYLENLLHKIETRNIEIKLSKRMRKIMNEAPGVGLAAPQLGILKRIITINVRESSDEKNLSYTLFNPEIISYSKNKVIMEEGCLSIPKQYADIERPEIIHFKYLNEKN